MTTPTLKIKVQPKTIIRGKMDVRFPARVLGRTGIAIEKTNGNFYFDVDYSLFGEVTDIGGSAEASTFIALWDQGQGTYNRISYANFKADLTASFDTEYQPLDATLTSLSGKTITGTGSIVLSNAPNITNPTGIVKADVGLGNVDNTSDTNKPVSTATQTVLNAKADLASPTFTGIPAGPTAPSGTNTTQLATTAFVLANAGGGFTQAGTGAVTRTMQDKARERVSAADFRNVADADDTNSIQRAINSLASTGGVVELGAGALVTSAVITISTNGITIRGAGREATKITSSSSGHTFAVISGTVGTGFVGLKLTRTTSAGSSQNGIHFTGLNETIFMSDVYVENHYNGIRFGTTSYSYILNVITSNNYNDGMYFTNDDGIGTGCQYTLEKCLSQQNDGYGYSFHATTASMSVGDWLNLTTFANKLGGFNIQGTSSFGMNAIRWVGGIVGEDGKHGVLLNSFNGSDHRISNVTFEIAGTAACGRNLATAATHQGNGVLITSDNGGVVFTDCVFIGNSWSGLTAFGARTQVTGCKFNINGGAALGGEQNGVYASGGSLQMVGCTSTGHAAYGVFLNTDGHMVAGNDLTGNTLGSLGWGATQSTTVAALNKGSTFNFNQTPGTSTNDNAPAGYVGQLISSTVASGSALSLTTGVALNVTSISLTAGDWDVSALVNFTGNTATTTSSWAASISTTSATHNFTGGQGFGATGNGQAYNQLGAGQNIGLPIPPVRMSLASTTTVYLVASAVFGTNTSAAFGSIRARRVR